MCFYTKIIPFFAFAGIYLKIFFIILDLQCSMNFRCTAKWPSYVYTHTHTHTHTHILFFYIILHHGPSELIRYSSLGYTAESHCLSIPNVEYIFISCIYPLKFLSVLQGPSQIFHLPQSLPLSLKWNNTSPFPQYHHIWFPYSMSLIFNCFRRNLPSLEIMILFHPHWYPFQYSHNPLHKKFSNICLLC